MREDIIKVSGCTAEQQARWRVAAGDASLAAWIRRAADASLDERTQLPAADIDRIEAALVEVRGSINTTQVGNNLNQIAAALNRAAKEERVVIGLELSEAKDAVKVAISEFEALREEVNEALALVRAMRP